MTHIFSAPHCALGGACIGASDGALGGSCDVALYGAFGCPSISGDGGDLVIAIWREGRSGCRTPRWECGLALFDLCRRLLLWRVGLLILCTWRCFIFVVRLCGASLASPVSVGKKQINHWPTFGFLYVTG